MSDGEQYCSISITVLLSALSPLSQHREKEREKNFNFYHQIKIQT